MIRAKFINHPINFSKQNSKLKIILIHPAGGTLICFNSLIKKLKNTFSIIGFQDPMISENFISFNTLSEMAESYLSGIYDDLLDNQLIFIGYSFGGVLAYEMINKLSQIGINVTHCFLVDAWGKTPFEHMFTKHYKKLASRQIRRLNIDQLPHFKSNKETWYDTIWNRLVLHINYTPLKNNLTQFFLYKPEEVLVEYKEHENWDNSWTNYVKHLTINIVPGNHENMLDSKYSHQLIAHISSMLEDYHAT